MDFATIQQKIDRGLIQSNVLLGQAKLLDESSRSTAQFLDVRYFPPYYHVAQQIGAEKVVQLGTVGGLPAMCFLQNCKTVKKWLALESSTVANLPANFIKSNIKSHLDGEVEFSRGTPAFLVSKIKSDNWGVALVSQQENLGEYLPVLWDQLQNNGLLIVDHIYRDVVKDAVERLTKAKNRTLNQLNTRYGMGIIIK